jgi:molybdate transport system ATP-binding protein
VSLSVAAATRLGPLELDVAVDVPPGRCLALAGPSGAGKTSVLRVVAGLLRPARGRVRCGDDVWLDTERRVWRDPDARRCGYLFQDYALFPHLSAWRNVAYPLRGLSRGERRPRAFALLERFGVGHLADARVGRLSGGERQRVALARALLRRPRLLILDEATSALDWENQSLIAQSIAALRGSLTVVTIAHRLSMIAFADHAVVVENGRVVETGPYAALAGQAGSRLARLVSGESGLNET